ncbi:hypothetical protein H7849_20070 [Alloacidobacterium dinghuense]|uniref:Uncharacterized protein n=1 Tax=Alloacidobacterium dinghuense TaxID=2763107 RepID=A0A7G8BFN7_9BACT|nr:hypothetical protein [Alloacidobacterium dinghuense]QNI31357.1 hypothetical protein H7849_20070 [Alloacidobacterium dinghuense]
MGHLPINKLLSRLLNEILFLFALVLSTLSALAADHASEYKVGIFPSTGRLRDGSYSNGETRGIAIYTADHNIHYVRTDDGMYSIYTPSVLGKTFLFKPLTNDGTLTDDDMTPNVHKQWFMDKLHDGAKFSSLPSATRSTTVGSGCRILPSKVQRSRLKASSCLMLWKQTPSRCAGKGNLRLKSKLKFANE